MKFIPENVFKYASVKLPMMGAFLLGVIIPLLEFTVQYNVIDPKYHNFISCGVLAFLSWFGRKLAQPELNKEEQQHD